MLQNEMSHFVSYNINCRIIIIYIMNVEDGDILDNN